MPRPLSEILPPSELAPVQWGAGSFEVHPVFAAHAMQVIQCWAQNDWALLTCLANFMRADTELVVATFRDVGHMSRKAALLTAAEERFNVDHYEVFAAALATTDASRARSNEFVHHVWGVCESVPDAVILADPKHLAAPFAHVTAPAAGGRTRSALSNGNGSSKSFAHYEQDFIDAVGAANRALKIINLLQRMSLINPPLYNSARFDSACEKLLTDPVIREALGRRRRA